MITILVFVALISLLLCALPAWSYSRYWGYYPSCTLGVVVFIFLTLVFRGFF